VIAPRFGAGGKGNSKRLLSCFLKAEINFVMIDFHIPAKYGEKM